HVQTERVPGGVAVAEFLPGPQGQVQRGPDRRIRRCLVEVDAGRGNRIGVIHTLSVTDAGQPGPAQPPLESETIGPPHLVRGRSPQGERERPAAPSPSVRAYGRRADSITGETEPARRERHSGPAR